MPMGWAELLAGEVASKIAIERVREMFERATLPGRGPRASSE